MMTAGVASAMPAAALGFGTSGGSLQWQYRAMGRVVGAAVAEVTRFLEQAAQLWFDSPPEHEPAAVDAERRVQQHARMIQAALDTMACILRVLACIRDARLMLSCRYARFARAPAPAAAGCGDLGDRATSAWYGTGFILGAPPKKKMERWRGEGALHTIDILEAHVEAACSATGVDVLTPAQRRCFCTILHRGCSVVLWDYDT